MEIDDSQRFPPSFRIGTRVWTWDGYRDHGPQYGPKVNIDGRQGGTIQFSEIPPHTDSVLFTVVWDNRQVSRHYWNTLTLIGRFQTFDEYREALHLEGPITIYVGPRGGFREASIPLIYDGVRQVSVVDSRELWKYMLEPMARNQGIKIEEQPITALESGDEH